MNFYEFTATRNQDGTYCINGYMKSLDSYSNTLVKIPRAIININVLDSKDNEHSLFEIKENVYGNENCM